MRHLSAASTIRVALVGAACCALLLSPTVAPGAPTNAKIEAARDQADAARSRLEDLAADLEERTEEYLEFQSELEQTRSRIRTAENELDSATRELDASEALLNRRASAIYRTGGLDFFSVVVGASDFTDLVSRIDLMRRVSRTDAAVVASVKETRARIEKLKRGLTQRKAEQVALRDRAVSKKREVESALRAQKKYLAGLDAKVRALVVEERERQERLAREAAAKAAVANRGRVDPSRPFDPAKLGTPHPEVVAVSKQYLGVPYVWGGTTPKGFDCSGLTQFSYRRIGINIPRTSRSQFRYGAYIPPNRLDLLRPGDLVFFGRNGDPNRVHHVGIFAGGDDFVHAPYTGAVVSVSSLSARINTKGDYVGATRP